MCSYGLGRKPPATARILSRGAKYYDQNTLGINPDYTIKIRHDILQETDGPMLKYGIQLFDNKNLILPKDKRNYPDKDSKERKILETDSEIRI